MFTSIKTKLFFTQI